MMQDKEFAMLAEILKSMGGRKGSLESTISSIINSYMPHLSDEQRNIVMKEFMNYTKEEHRKSNLHFEKMLEEEKYKDLLSSFIGSRDVVGL
jgi:hypothetical protein